MANRWCDGLGRYGGDETKMLNGSSSQAWAQIGSYWELSSENARTGTHCLRLPDSVGIGAGGETWARRVFGDTLAEVYVGFAIYVHELPSTEFVAGVSNGVILPMLVDQANVGQLWFMLGTDGSIAVYRDVVIFGGTFSSGTLLGRTVPIIGAGAYQHIEIYAKAGNGDGAVEIRVDEITRLNLTGAVTVSTSNVEFSQARWGSYGSTERPGAIDFADYFANDTVDDGSGCNDFIGDCKSGTLMVDADTAQADWSLSSGGSGYALLDETPPNDSGYIFTESSTAESHFGFADGPDNLTEILTVRPFDRAFKDDAGSCLIGPTMVSNAVKASVDPQPISTGASYYDSNVPFDPDTDAPWTLSGLNAALRAVERTE